MFNTAGYKSKIQKALMVGGLLLLSSIVAPFCFANSWTYEQTFNGLTNGTLAGQDSWGTFGTDVWKVEPTTTYEGAKAVTVSGSANAFDYRRDVTAVSGSGDVYFAIRTHDHTRTHWTITLNNSAITLGVRITMLENDNISVATAGSGDSKTIVTGYANDTWYLIDLQFDTVAGTAKARAYDGVSWSSFTANVTESSTFTIGDIRLSGGSTDGTNVDLFLDSISPNDLTPVGGGGGTTTTLTRPSFIVLNGVMTSSTCFLVDTSTTRCIGDNPAQEWTGTTSIPNIETSVLVLTFFLAFFGMMYALKNKK